MDERTVYVAVLELPGGGQEIEVRTDEETIQRLIHYHFPAAIHEGEGFYYENGFRVARYVARRVAWLPEVLVAWIPETTTSSDGEGEPAAPEETPPPATPPPRFQVRCYEHGAVQRVWPYDTWEQADICALVWSGDSPHGFALIEDTTTWQRSGRYVNGNPPRARRALSRTLYDVELWRAGRYAFTLAGPFNSQAAAERAAEIDRQRIWEPGDEIRITPFETEQPDSQPGPRSE